MHERRCDRFVRAGAARSAAGQTETTDVAADDHRGARARRHDAPRRRASRARAAPTTSPAARSRSCRCSKPRARGRRSPSRTWRWTARGRCTKRGCGCSTATSTSRSCSRRAGPALSVSLRETLTFQLDPYYLVPLGADYVSLSALQAQAVLAATGKTETDLAEIVARSPARREGQPERRRCRATSPSTTCSPRTTWSRRCASTTSARRSTARPRSCSSPVTARARSCERPAWIAGHRPPRRSALPGRARSRDVAVDDASRASGPASASGGVEVAELTAVCSPEELVLADALGLGDDVDVNPSGGALVAQPGDGDRPGPHRRGVPAGERARQATGARARVVGPVPATEPRLRPGSDGRSDGGAVCGCRHRADEDGEVPRRRVDGRARAAKPRCARSKTRR